VYNFLCLPALLRFVCTLLANSFAYVVITSSTRQDYSRQTASGSTVNHNTTVGMNDLPTDLGAVRAGKENKHSRDLTRLSTTPNGSAKGFLRLLRHGRNDQRGPNGTGSDSVDADALGHPLVAEAVGESGDGALSARVVEQIRAADVGVHAGIVDDCVALGHVREGVLGEVEEGCEVESVSSRGGGMAVRLAYHGCWCQTS
jgi:hypothetical protein